jgi:serine/threonine protein kinase
MPAPSSTTELLDLLRKSELVPLPKLEAFLERVRMGAPTATPRELADMMVVGGLATQFQIEQLLQGKWRGFTIGKYRVLERLGTGGMGSVYLCEHMVMGRRVAVKVLPTSQADNPASLARFYREARASGVLDHPNLVKAHDIDQDGPLHFLVMEYIDGINLQDLVARVGPLTPQRAAHYISMAAEGLHAAFRTGLVHRDVKPANLILERNGNVRVLDLGLARFYNDHGDLLTLKYDEKNVLGTADYVAPEQAINSHEVDIRADVYSLGGTFYYLLSGRPPFVGGKVAQKLIWHQMKQPPSLTELRPELPRALVGIVGRMMAKNPSHRYQTPAEVVAALRPWTSDPIPLPTEEEMPAQVPGPQPPPSSGVNKREPAPENNIHEDVPRPAPVAERKPRPASTEAMPAVAVASPPRPVNTELATPRALAAHTSTVADQPRAKKTVPAAPVSPSKLLADEEPAVAEDQPESSWIAKLGFLVLVVVGGTAVGLALGWVMGRF